MKLPHGWVLIRGFNLCCEVHRCHLMGCEIPGQRGQPLCWPYCMFQVVNPWCALQGWTAPAVQSHLLKLLSLLYMKIHEIKLKISVPFTLTYIYFCFVFNVCLFFFYLKFEPAAFRIFSNEHCRVVAFQHSLVARAGSVPPGHNLLSPIRSLRGCVLTLQCLNVPLSFHLLFQFVEPFFMNSTLEDKLPGGEESALLIQASPFCLGQGAAVSHLGSVFIQEWGIPSSQLTLSYACLPSSVIPHSWNWRRICQVCSLFCC